MPRVSKRGGFSDRNGIKPESVEIQLKTINEQIQNIAQKKDTLCRRMYN